MSATMSRRRIKDANIKRAEQARLAQKADAPKPVAPPQEEQPELNLSEDPPKPVLQNQKMSNSRGRSNK